jgi:alkane 1-monooxygenase
MLQFQGFQLGFLGGIYFLGGLEAAILMRLAGFLGAILLETINYIEHYGLVRQKTESGLYEIVTEKHSWNSNHIIGRLLLFELSRHSDHHAKSTKKYQELRSLENAPQMPTGYPGMMVLSLIYPLWIGVMNPLVKKFNSENGL